MNSSPIKNRFLPLFSILFLFFLVIFSSNAENFNSLITQAWREYGFKEIEKAQRLFKKADNLASTKQEKCEVIAGKAFCLQFGKRTNITTDDYLQAINLYDAALNLLDKNDKLRPFFLAMKAEAFINLANISQNKSDSAKFANQANELWKILDEDYKTDVFRQDSLLTRSALISTDYKDESSLKAHQELKQFVSEINKNATAEEKLLASVMCSQIAEHAYLNENYSDAVKYLKLYCEFGPTSFPMKANAYFRLARIAECKTNDKNTAIEFYRRFYHECNANEKSFFAKKKAEELSGQKIENEE